MQNELPYTHGESFDGLVFGTLPDFCLPFLLVLVAKLVDANFVHHIYYFTI